MARGARALLLRGQRQRQLRPDGARVPPHAGLGVPRSCQTAVLYYQPVAEQVVELARTPNSLPYVSRFPCPASVTKCQLSGSLI